MRSSSAVYTRARIGFAATAAVAALAALAPSAQAHDNFDPTYAAECADPNSETRTPLVGVGASFQRSAQIAWGADIVAADRVTLLAESAATGAGVFTDAVRACNPPYQPRVGLQELRYRPEGSGAGRSAFGATDTPGGARDASVAFGGADEAPTATQITNANAGNTSISTDNDRLHTIPNAQGAIALVGRIPDGCQIRASSDGTGPLRRLGRNQIDYGFTGASQADTWGELTQNLIVGSSGGLTDAQCRAKNFSRVVRSDVSGTTFQFKRYLAEVGRSGTAWASLGNTAWPASGTNPLVTASGNGGVVSSVNGLATNGAVGYADLASARSGGFGWDGTDTDRTVWFYVQRIADNSYRSPAIDNAQAGTRGANCANAEYNDYSLESDPVNNGAVLPADTTTTWFNVDAIRTTEDYPVCTLTYALTFEHPNTLALSADPDWTQARARARVSYLEYTINGGQSVLSAADYAPLPTTVQLASQAGVDELGH